MLAVVMLFVPGGLVSLIKVFPALLKKIKGTASHV
jgi:hypothetical protein